MKLTKTELTKIERTHKKHLKDGWLWHQVEVKEAVVVARQVRYYSITEQKVKLLFMYYGLSSYEELAVYMATTNDNLFEILNEDERIVYMDMDGFKYNPIEVEEAEDMVETIITDVNEELATEVKRDDVVVLVNEGYEEDGVCSIHMTIPSLSMRALEQKCLITGINDKHSEDKNASKLKLDDAVYNKNQKFRLYNQSKLNIEDGSNKYVAVGLNKTYDPLNTMLSITENSKLIKYKVLIKDDTKLKEKMIRLGADAEIVLNEDIVLNSCDVWATKLDVAFYSSSDWRHVLDILMKLAHGDKTKVNWFDIYSRRVANNPSYTKKANLEVINSVDYKAVKSGMPRLISILNKNCKLNYFTREFNVFDKDKAQLAKWVEKHELDIVVNELHEHNKHAQKRDLILKNEVWEINLKNGMVHNKQTDKILNFKLSSNIKETKIFTEVSIPRMVDENADVVEEWQTHINDYMEDAKKKWQPVRADWCCGKSRGVMMPIIEHAFNTSSIINISSHTSLNNKLQDDCEKYSFVSHLNETGDLSIHDKLICSPQSLNRVGDKKYDIVIVDEACNIISQYSGKNFKDTLGTPSSCYKKLIDLCLHAKKVIFMDADLKHDLLQMIINSVGDDLNDIKIYDIKDNKYLDYNYKICRTEKTFLNNFYKHFDLGKRIYLPSASKEFADAMYESIMKRNPERRVCYISSDGVKRSYEDGILKDDGAIKDKSEYIKHLNTKLIDEDVEIWITTPTIVVGTSINDVIFDITFAYFTPMSLPVEQSTQMIFRVRSVKDKEVYIGAYGVAWSNYNHLSVDEVKFHIENETDLFKKTSKDEHNINYVEDPIFAEVLTYNRYNKINSREAFGNELIGVLERHNLNWEFVKDDKKATESVDDLLGDRKKIKYEKEEVFYNTLLITIYDFLKLKKKMKDKTRTDLITEEEQLQYFKMYTYLSINNIFIIPKKNSNGDMVESINNKIELDDMDNKNEVLTLLDNRDYLPNDNNKNLEVGVLMDTSGNPILDANKKPKMEYKKPFNIDIYKYVKKISQLQSIRRAVKMWNNPKSHTDNGEMKDIEIENDYTIDCRETILIKMIKMLGFNWKTQKSITNKEFNLMINNNKEDIILCLTLACKHIKYNKEEADKVEALINVFQSSSGFDVKKIQKQTYHTFKTHLEYYDISVRYYDENHTDRDRDKIIIYPKNELVNFNVDMTHKNNDIIEYDKIDKIDEIEELINITSETDVFNYLDKLYSTRPLKNGVKKNKEYANKVRTLLTTLISREHKVGDVLPNGIINNKFYFEKNGKNIQFPDVVEKLLNNNHASPVDNRTTDFKLVNDLDVDMSDGSINKVVFTNGRKDKYTDANKKTLYPLNEQTITWIMNPDGTYTMGEPRRSYRPYEVKQSSMLTEIKTYVDDRLYIEQDGDDDDVVENIKVNKTDYHIEIKADIRMLKRFTLPQVIVKHDECMVEFIKEGGRLYNEDVVDVVDVDDLDDDVVDDDEYDDEDGDGVYIKKPDVIISYYEKTIQHIEDIEAEQTKKRNKTLAYLNTDIT